MCLILKLVIFCLFLKKKESQNCDISHIFENLNKILQWKTCYTMLPVLVGTQKIMLFGLS